MAGIFTDGEIKIRPGVYFNVSTNDSTGVIGAQDGIVAVVFRGTFGPLNEPVKLTSETGWYDLFGDGGHVDTIEYAFLGGAKTVIAVRAGTEGTAAKTQLGEIVTITAKYPGSRAFSISVRDSLMDEAQKDVVIYSGNRAIETYSIKKDSDKEGAALKEAMARSSRFSVKIDTDGQLPAVTQQLFTAGTDPVTDVESYSAAFEKLESQSINSICVDTEETAVHLLLKSFLDRAYDKGFYGCAVIAELSGKDKAQRIASAGTLNDEKMIYLLNAHALRMEKELDGYQTAAIVAGMYASYPSSKSLTHKVIPGITELSELLTPSEMEEAEVKGCLVLSNSPEGKTWIDNAINTLVEPPENKDDGWKKIRRTKTRFELMYRMNTTADGLVGNVDNDKNGRETVIAKLNEVGAAMIQEGKLISCQVSEHPTLTANADYAYFLIDVVDKDSLEHMYLYYNFTYNTEEG